MAARQTRHQEGRAADKAAASINRQQQRTTSNAFAYPPETASHDTIDGGSNENSPLPSGGVATCEIHHTNLTYKRRFDEISLRTWSSLASVTARTPDFLPDYVK